MYADAVIAAILQADLLETPIKNTSTNAKIDRMHFKVQLFFLSSINNSLFWFHCLANVMFNDRNA